MPPFASDDDAALAARFLADRPVAAAVFQDLCAFMDTVGPCTLTATRSRVAFTARTRFAWIHEATRDGVWLAFLLPRPEPSPRLRTGPSGARFSHHLKVTGPPDEALARWLRDAYAADGAEPAATVTRGHPRPPTAPRRQTRKRPAAG